MMNKMVQKKFFKIQVTLEDHNRWIKECNVSQVCLISLLKIEYFAKSLACPCVMSFTYEFRLIFNRSQLQVGTCFWPKKILGLLLKNYASFAVERILWYQTSLLWQFREFSSLQTDHPKTKIETKRKQKWITIVSLQRKGSLTAWG